MTTVKSDNKPNGSSTFLDDAGVKGSGKTNKPKKKLEPLTKEDLSALTNPIQQSSFNNMDVNAAHVEPTQSFWDRITPDADKELATANELERDAYNKAITAKYTNSKDDIDAAKVAQNKFNSALRTYFAKNPDATYHSTQDYEKKITSGSIPKDYAGYAGQTKTDSTGKVSALKEDGTWTPYQDPKTPVIVDEKAKTSAVEAMPTSAPWGTKTGVSKWKNVLIPAGDGTFFDPNTDKTALSLSADEAGNIFLSGDKLETQDLAIQRVLSDFSKHPEKIKTFQDTLIARGFVTASEANMINSWRSYNTGTLDPTSMHYLQFISAATTAANVSTLNTSQSANPRLLSIDGYLKNGPVQAIKDFIKQNGGTGGGSGVPSHTVEYRTQKYTQNDLEIGIDKIFQNLTGMGASEEDVKHLTDWVNQRSTTKTVTNRHGNTANTVTSGGISSDAIDAEARKRALNTQGAEEYNKATSYMNYFMDAINSPIQLG